MSRMPPITTLTTYLFATTDFVTLVMGGTLEITAAAHEFMSAFPDMVVTMDDLRVEGDHAVYRWTLAGANTGPGGTGNSVRISGYEEWTIGADGLIADSKGHFDAADYARQLNAGVDDS